jgi:hypothetical protein
MTAEMDCFVAALLAMTVRMRSYIRRHSGFALRALRNDGGEACAKRRAPE